MTVVFPRPGDHVVWLLEPDNGGPEFERLDGRWALVTNPEAGQHVLSYDVLAPYATVGEGGIQIEVDYYDEGTAGDRFQVEYDALYPRTGEDRFQTSAEVVKSGEEGWHTHRFVLPRPAFGGREAGEPDFRIYDAGDGREIIGRVRLSPAEL
jgi:CRISPR-associated Cas5-like protein